MDVDMKKPTYLGTSILTWRKLQDFLLSNNQHPTRVKLSVLLTQTRRDIFSVQNVQWKSTQLFFYICLFIPVERKKGVSKRNIKTLLVFYTCAGAGLGHGL